MQKMNVCKKVVRFIFIFLTILSVVYLSSCDKDKVAGDLICKIEDGSSDKLIKLAWLFTGDNERHLYNVNVYTGTSSEEIKVKHNPSKSYVELDSDLSNQFKVTVSMMDHEDITKTVMIYLVDSINNEKLDIYYENNNNVKIKFDKKIENSTCFIKLDNEIYTQVENEINLASDQVNYKEIKICERSEYVDNIGFQCFKISKYSSPLLIELPQYPIITFKPISTDEFMYKCDSFNGFSKFDIELVQDEKVIFSENNVTKKRFAGGTFTIKQSELLDADLTINVFCYGSLSDTQKVADVKYSKTYKYVPLSELVVKNGSIDCEVADNMESYLLDVTTFADNQTKNYNFVESKNLKLVAQEAYKLKANIVYKGQFFSKAITKDWFTFFAKPSINLIDKTTITYNVGTTGINNANLHVVITKDGKSINAFDMTSNIFSLNGEGKKYITESGIYSISVTLNPVEGAVKYLDGSIPCDVYPSESATASVIKTATPDVKIEKANNGQAIKFVIDGYDEYKATIPGQINSLFSYKDKVSYFELTNEALNFDNATRTVTIVAKKKGFDGENVLVLESDPVEISNIKILSQPKNNIEVLTSKDGNPILSFADKDLSTGKYNAYLYYVSTGDFENYVNMITIDNAYQFNFNSFFNSVDEIKAGTYNVKIERTSDINTDLNSKLVVFSVQKLDTPTLDKTESTDSLICWKCKISDNLRGYRVKYKGIIEETLDVNKRIDSEELEAGETTVEVVAYGAGLTIWSNPLIVRLYKFSQADLQIEDNVLSYTNDIDSKIVVNAIGTMYFNNEVVNEGSFTGNNVNIKTLTSGKYFESKEDKEFTIVLTLKGHSSYYDFIYESKKSISFVKLGLPDINLTTSPITEKNNKAFMMSSDADPTWREPADAFAVKGNMYFYKKGNGKTTIDSCILVENKQS